MTRMIVRLRYPAICRSCSGQIPAGAEARRFLHDGKNAYVCLPCAPVTRLADGTAEGAVDSSKALLKAKSGKGKALKTGVPTTASKPGKRKRPTGNQRDKHST